MKKFTKYPVTAAVKTRVVADEEDLMFDEDLVDDDEALQDTITDVADTIDDLQDAMDDVVPDDVSIDMNNNITDHFIAECEYCHGVFISAVVKSDAMLKSIHGTCPLCDRESDQYLKWLIIDAESSDDII